MNDAESTPQSNEASLAERGEGAPSVGSKKTAAGRKKQNRFGSEASGRQQRSMAGGALTREERKNEQIIRMIERQENLMKRRERRKQGLPVSNLGCDGF